MLGIHGEQINRLLVNAQALLSAINQRSQAVEALLGNVTAVASQIHGLIDDNPNLNTVLKQVNTISDVLVKRKDDLVSTVTELGKFVASLSEIVASGPYVKAAIFNIVPYQLLQPFVDAAFKKRGIDPENFWRGAGLPAFQWPDPNGSRIAERRAATGAAGAGGHPGAPGPGRPAGFAVLVYACGGRLCRRPGNPLPCAGRRRSVRWACVSGAG